METKELSIADLKAAFDFAIIELNNLLKKAKEDNVNPERIPAFNDIKKVEFMLYHELLNRTLSLK